MQHAWPSEHEFHHHSSCVVCIYHYISINLLINGSLTVISHHPLFPNEFFGILVGTCPISFSHWGEFGEVMNTDCLCISQLPFGSTFMEVFLHNCRHLTHIQSNELFIQATTILNKFVTTNCCTLYNRSLYYSQCVVVIGAMRCNYEYVHLWYSVSRCLLTVLLAGLFSRVPAGLHLTWGICCPLPTLCPSAPSFICAHCLLLYHTLAEKQQMYLRIIRTVLTVFLGRPRALFLIRTLASPRLREGI